MAHSDPRPLARTNVTLPANLLEEVDPFAGPRGRSRYVAEAVAQRVRRDALGAAIRETAGAMVGQAGWMNPDEVAAGWTSCAAEETDGPMRYLLDTTPLIDTPTATSRRLAVIGCTRREADLFTCDVVVCEALSGGSDEQRAVIGRLLARSISWRPIPMRRAPQVRRASSARRRRKAGARRRPDRGGGDEPQRDDRDAQSAGLRATGRIGPGLTRVYELTSQTTNDMSAPVERLRERRGHRRRSPGLLRPSVERRLPWAPERGAGG